ncbi:sugar ABC transporter permease [Rhodobacteraceae bacterium 2376]|uniref:Sugar ABC transporter permease n=1 Tax=Rhabdonatronobacter sediminivivens TaxID=2743469 RepID=A0A7Z0HY28_9RHOB|nr:sugar ABC transporter permease [Rhabdonatronobacter sediminivivens]NYS24295.1 sugar ABC transporter permease [Rhabdonatronobacter sediminivivens]
MVQIRAAGVALYEGAFNLLERPMLALQRVLGQHRLAWVFLLPNLLIFGLFTFVPIILNFAFATTSGDRIIIGDRPYVGAANFASLLDCESYLNPNTCRRDLFWRAVHNTGWFVVLQVGFMVLFSLITALILNRDIVLRGFFRAVFFYPVLLSPVVVALIWKWILQRNGVLNAGLDWAGFGTVNWLLEANWAFFWIVFVSIWANMGFYVLILLAGLQSIPGDVYEAAEMDGTPRWRQLLRITLPLLMPTMLVVLVLSLIRAVQAFDEIYVLTGGGPGSATTLLIQYIYDVGFATRPRVYGLAAAASLMMAGVLFVLTMAQLAATRKRGEDG